MFYTFIKHLTTTWNLSGFRRVPGGNPPGRAPFARCSEWLPQLPPPKPSSVCRRWRHSRGLTRKNYFQTFFFVVRKFFWGTIVVSCLQDFLNRKREEILYCIYIYKHTWFYMFFEAKILYQWYGFLRYFEYFVSVTPRSKRGSSEGQWRNLGWIDVSKGVTSYPPWLGHLIFLLEHHQLLQDLLGKT